MLLYSLRPRAGRNLLLAMGLVLSLFAVYYAVQQAWAVVTAGVIVAVALFILGGRIAVTDAHPAKALVLAGLVSVNVAAVLGISALALQGIVWFAPLVFVNFLFGGIRLGTAVTIVTATVIVIAGGHYASADLTLNIIGALVLSLFMAATYGHGLQDQFQRLESEALHDELTQLRNRRAFDRALENRLGEALGTGALSLVLFDLDHFKRLNDRHGHEIGDRVLRQFARIATDNLRQTDHVYRYGGEEFAVLLDVGADDALHVAQKVHSAIEAGDFCQGIAVTVSAGVAEVYPGDSERNLVRRADAALYAAKANGRNRCEIARGDVVVGDEGRRYVAGAGG